MKNELTSEQIAQLVNGMEVSIDVSTGEHDAGNRLFGKVTEVQGYDSKNGLILLVQEPEPNFKDAQAAEIVALKADRDEWKESTIDANKLVKTAERQVAALQDEIAALKDQLDHMQAVARQNGRHVTKVDAEIAALRQDKARLDWVLANRFYRVQGNDEQGWCVLDCSNGLTFTVRDAKTAREAIDAAIAQAVQPS